MFGSDRVPPERLQASLGGWQWQVFFIESEMARFFSVHAVGVFKKLLTQPTLS